MMSLKNSYRKKIGFLKTRFFYYLQYKKRLIL